MTSIGSPRFRVEKVLRDGADVRVYRALDILRPDKSSILKVGPLPSTEELGQETEYVRQLAHPCLPIWLEDGALACGRRYLVTDDLQGTVLGATSWAAWPDLPRAVVRDLLRVLRFLHGQGIIHHDIKPTNIVARADEGCHRGFLIDLGLAGGSDPSSARRGTPEYWAPEVFTSSGTDARTDLYALGVTLYEWLTGTRAFESSSLSELARQHKELLSESPLETTSAPAWLKHLIMWCLQTAPEDRPQSAEAALSYLRQTAGLDEGIESPETATAWIHRGLGLLIGQATQAVVATVPWATYAVDCLSGSRGVAALLRVAFSAKRGRGRVVPVRRENRRYSLREELALRLMPALEGGTEGGTCLNGVSESILAADATVVVLAQQLTPAEQTELKGLADELAHVAARGGGSGALVVPGHIADQVGIRGVTRVGCERLGKGDVSEVLCAGLGLRGWDLSDSELLLDRTGGDPSLLIADVLELIRREVIVPDGHGWKLLGEPDRALAQREVEAAVGERLRGLDAISLGGLTLTACAGGSLDMDVLRRIVGEGCAEVCVEGLISAGLCEVKNETMVIVSGRVVSGAIALAGVSEERRKCRMLMSALQESDQGLTRACCWLRAEPSGTALEAVEAGIAEAEAAGDRLGVERGLRAILQSEILEPAHRGTTYLRLARVLGERGEWRGAVEALAMAKPLVDKNHRIAERLFTAKALLRLGRKGDASGAAADVLAVRSELTPEERVEVAEILTGLGDLDCAERELRDALGQANELALAARGRAFKALGSTLAQSGRLDEALGLLGRGLRVARSCGDRDNAAATHTNIANILMARRDRRARKHLTTALVLYRDQGDTSKVASAIYSLARCNKIMGALDEAREQYEECRVYAERAGLVDVSLSARLALANTSLEMGDNAEATGAFRQLACEARGTHENVRSRCLYGLALIQLNERRNLGVARRLALRALGAKEPGWRGHVHALIGHIDLLVSDAHSARWHLARAYAHSHAQVDKAFALLMLACFATTEPGSHAARESILRKIARLATRPEMSEIQLVCEVVRNGRNASDRAVRELWRYAIESEGGTARHKSSRGMIWYALSLLGRVQPQQLADQEMSIWTCEALLMAWVQLATRYAERGHASVVQRVCQDVSRELVKWRTGANRVMREHIDSHRSARELCRLLQSSVDAEGCVGETPVGTLLRALAERKGEDAADRKRVRREDGLRHILEISQALKGTLGLPELLELIAESVVELCRAERAFVILTNDDRGVEWDIAVSRDWKGDEIVNARNEASGTIVARVLAGGRASLHQDALGEYGLGDRPSIQALELKSIACVPMMDRGRCLGVLYADNRSQVGTFDEIDLEVLTVFAMQAASAIANGRLFKELEASQRALGRAERIRVLGEMASGVAHDFNNVLTAILARSQLLQSEVVDEDVRRELGVIEKAASDGAAMVRRIQDFTRVRRDREREVCDLCEVARDALAFTGSRLRGAMASGCGISVSLDVVNGEALVEGCPSELREVFTNLIINAIEAMPQGGELAIRVVSEGDTVRCEVRDSGVGIGEDVAERVWDPFFTTKGSGGSGLGLSLAYGIVTRHGGEIGIESRVGEGARVWFWLPRVSGRRREVKVGRRVGGVIAGRRVLVVDDEREVSDVAVRILELEGAVVRVAACGREAVEEFRRGQYDLVLTDLGMPGMDGYEVVRQIRQSDTHVRIVVMTGWGVSVEAEELRSRGIDGVVLKPFRVEDLVAKVTS